MNQILKDDIREKKIRIRQGKKITTYERMKKLTEEGDRARYKALDLYILKAFSNK